MHLKTGVQIHITCECADEVRNASPDKTYTWNTQRGHLYGDHAEKKADGNHARVNVDNQKITTY